MFEKIKKFFLYFSVIFLIAGVTSFTAYNWATMSSIEKLAVPSALIIAGLGAYLFLKKIFYKKFSIVLFFVYDRNFVCSLWTGLSNGSRYMDIIQKLGYIFNYSNHSNRILFYSNTFYYSCSSGNKFLFRIISIRIYYSIFIFFNFWNSIIGISIHTKKI